MNAEHAALAKQVREALEPIAARFKEETGLAMETVSIITRQTTPPMHGVVWRSDMSVEVMTKWGWR